MDKDKHIGILGAGVVGITLANGLKSKGFQVAIGNRKGTAVEGWDGKVGTFAEIADRADSVILAVQGTVAEEVIAALSDSLKGKVVIDATNPIKKDVAPDEGVLDYFTTFSESLMERLQNAAPGTKFVKAFNQIAAHHMIDPQFIEKPTMLICGNDNEAKTTVTQFLESLGWGIADYGSAKSARGVEPLGILTCIPGILNNDWDNAFRIVRPTNV